MEIYTDVRQANLTGPTCLTIGTLDGMHRGHQALVVELGKIAQNYPEDNANIGLITFDPHPRAVLKPEAAPKLLSTPEERMEQAAKAGATFGIIQSFTTGISQFRAISFMSLLKENLGLTTLAIGPDFALGKGRSGNIDRLREIGQEIGYEVIQLPQVEWQGEPVRSSRIRELLCEGNVEVAAGLLARPYAIPGLVVDGDKRGRTIGVPTANLVVAPERLLPADGVYATRTWIESTASEKAHQWSNTGSFASVTNLGVRPTVNGREHRFETHLLDFPPEGLPDDLYGDTLRVEFIARLRGEKRFDGLDALVTQIQADIKEARAILS